MKHPLSTFTLLRGCTLATDQKIITSIYCMTNGDPCEGCSYNGCWLHVWMKKNKPTAVVLKTNRELAKEHGISARQVSRRRIPGTDILAEEAQDECSNVASNDGGSQTG